MAPHWKLLVFRVRLLPLVKRETGDCCPVTDFCSTNTQQTDRTEQKVKQTTTIRCTYVCTYVARGPERWQDSPRGGGRVPQIERPTNINRLVTGYCSRSIPGRSCAAAARNAFQGLAGLSAGPTSAFDTEHPPKQTSTLNFI